MSAPVRPQPLVVAQGDWWREGACRDEDPSLFFSAAYEHEEAHKIRVAAALAVCEGCGVRGQCRAWGEAHEEHGIWGGVDHDTRSWKREKRLKPKKGPLECRCGRCGEIFEISSGYRMGTCARCAMEYRERNPAADKRRTRLNKRAESGRLRAVNGGRAVRAADPLPDTYDRGIEMADPSGGP